MGHDYKKLGFKCGIEIHQQLEGKKLFCNCPTEIRKTKPDFTFQRRLRAAAGETGKADQAAVYEMEKGKLFEYQGYEDINCLVEMDEEPPSPMNQEALMTTLQVCKMLNAKIVDQVQVMRKIVVDGSNVSGFQRTSLIGVDGYVEVNGKKIGIQTICLEEESCQVMKRSKDKDSYNLSRLGIPLIEIATDPDITSPEECKEVASKLGMILRSTGKMKRGIGSIRQDVNLSIKGHDRVEIKGFQDLKSIPKVIDNEISRQLKEKEESHVRKAEPDFSSSYLRPMPGAARMYPETDIPKITPPSAKNIQIPELLDHKADSFEKKFKLPQGYGNQLIKANVDFNKLAQKFNKVEHTLLAEFFIKYPKDLKKRENIDFEPHKNLDILEELNKGIPKSALHEIILARAQGKKVDFSKFKSISNTELEKAVKEILKKNSGAPMGVIIGQVMSKYKGRVEGKRVSEMIRKLS